MFGIIKGVCNLKIFLCSGFENLAVSVCGVLPVGHTDPHQLQVVKSVRCDLSNPTGVAAAHHPLHACIGY